MSLVTHATEELKLLGYDPDSTEDGPNTWIAQNIIELMEVFARQGHSGSSAPYVLDLFNRLAKYQVVAPLTGEDTEWSDILDMDGPTLQNRRCSSVFTKNGIAYTIDGYAFWYWSERDLEPNEDGYPGVTKFKSTFTSEHSRKEVTFPYAHEDAEHIEVESYEVNKDTGEREVGSGWWHTIYPDHIVENTNALRAKLGESPRVED